MKNLSKNKNGMSLVDMIMAIAIFMLGIGGFTLLFMKGWRANSYIKEMGDTTSIAARAIEQTAEDLRKVRYPCAGTGNTYNPIENGSNGFDLTVYLDDDNDGTVERVHYYLNNRQLIKGVRKPGSGCTFAAGDATTKVVANYVMNTNAQPVFAYYNSNYPGDTVNNPLNTSPLVVDQVKLIKLHLWVNIKPLTAPDNVNFETFINLRNLNENI